MTEERLVALHALSQEISQCRRCDQSGIKVSHASPLERGKGSKILVIGIEPGKSEIARAQAFIGPAGKRLMEWLRQAGAGKNRNEILSACYLTSLCKCHITNKNDLRPAVRNCFPFLERQITLIQPDVCITLGREPLSELFGYVGELDDVIGNAWKESEIGLGLAPLFPPTCVIVPFPHPSPLSRWLNSEENKKRLIRTIALLKELLK